MNKVQFIFLFGMVMSAFGYLFWLIEQIMRSEDPLILLAVALGCFLFGAWSMIFVVNRIRP